MVGNLRSSKLIQKKSKPGRSRGWRRRLLTETLESRIVLSAVIGNNIGVGDELQNYRLAIAATAEYTAFFGGESGALAAIEAFVSDANAIFEDELSIHFDLVTGTNTIFTDSVTDGYMNGDTAQMLDANTGILDGVIGNANYDIGHVFGLASSGGSGLAGLGVVNDPADKGRGASIFVNPQGSDWVRLVAHEIGHQFGAEHTFNGNQYGSAVGTREPDNAYEPASGSTLMSYAGISGQDDLQADPDPYFHAASYEAIQTFIDASAPPNSVTPTGNTIPTVSGGTNYTIPAGTPFQLLADGFDADSSDTLTYTWEQLDLGAAMSLPITDNGESPLFRSFPPTANPTRVFPRLDDLVTNVNTAAIGEALPTTNRDLNFRTTVRDGKGGVHSDDVLITVVDTGTPFAVTSPNTAVDWTGGSPQTILWNVGGTDPGAVPANGISVANVGIDLSLDGGFSFPITLSSSTPNDGSHDIIVPNIDVGQARIRVRGDGNVFFDLSDSDFTISANESSPGITVTETDGDTKVGEGLLAGSSVDTYELSVNTTPTGPVQVTVNADLQTEVSLDGTTFSSNVIVDFSDTDTTPKTVYVRGFDDATVEGIHTGTVTHAITSSSDGNYGLGTVINPVTVTIADDESPPLIGVDFGPDGTDSPTNWTLVTDTFGSTTTELENELGISTAVDLTVAVSGGANLVNSNVIPNLPDHSPSLEELEGVRFATSSFTLTWNDLIPGTEYDLWLFASENFSNTVAQDVTIVGEQTLPTFRMDTNPIGASLLVNEAVADPARTLSPDAKRAVADAAGQIRIDLAVVSGNQYVLLNGAAIQAVATDPSVNNANLSVTTNGNEQGPVDVVFTVTLDQPNDTGGPITFDFDDLGTGSATAGADYATVDASAQISIDSGATTGTITIPVTDDAQAESTETIDAQISNASDGNIAIVGAAATAEILDDESPSVSSLIGIDFESAGTSPTNWTVLDSFFAAGASDLMAEDGATTSVDITSIFNALAAGARSLTPISSSIPQHTQSLSGIDTVATSDTAGSSYVARLSDLVPDAEYRVYVFGMSDDFVNQYSNEVTLTGSNVVSFTQPLDNNELNINGSVGANSQQLADYAELIFADSSGEIVIEVSASAGADGFGIAGLAIQKTGRTSDLLSVSFDATEISENGGTATGTVSRSTGTVGDLVVTLASDDLTEAVVPSMVTIPDGSDFVTFPVTAVDDSELDGTQSVTITASAIGLSGGQSTIDVVDDDTLSFGPLVGVDFVWNLNSPQNWNPLGSTVLPAIAENLIDENGDTTQIDLELSGGSSQVNGFPAMIDPSTLPNYTQSLAALDDQIYSSASSVTFKWTELSSLANYEVFVFGLDSDFSVTQAVTITGAGAAQNFTQQFAPNELAVNDAVGSSLQSLSDYAKQVQANAQGEITIDVNSVGNSFVSFAGLAIREVLAAQPITADLAVTTQGDEVGPIDIVYTVTLSEPNDTGVPITFDLNDLGTGSATSGLDYATIPPAAQINVASGSSTGTFAVTVLDDSLAEVNESVDVEISNPSDSSITLGVRNATASIRDDDPATLTVDVVATEVSENAGVAATIVTITRNTDTTNPLTVDLTSSDPTEATIQSTATILAGQASVSVNLDAVDDALVDGTQTVTITATSGGGNAQLDASFGTLGLATTTLHSLVQPPRTAITTQSDGKILAASEGPNENQIRLIRHNADGTVDTSFGSLGTSIITTGVSNPVPNSIIAQADGKIIVGGKVAAGVGAPFLFRADNNGGLDAGYGVNGFADFSFVDSVGAMWINDMESTADGKVLAALGISGSVFFRAMRVNADGTLDSTFGSGGLRTYSGYPVAATQVDVLLSGQFLLLGNISSDATIIRADANGAIDSSFGNSGAQIISFPGVSTGNLESLDVDASGRIIIGGNLDGDFAVARLNSNGTFDTSFDTDGKVTAPGDVGSSDSGVASSLQVQPDGKVVLVGYRDGAAENEITILQFNVDGSPDTAFGPDGRFVYSGSSSTSRRSHGSVLLPDGALLVLSGWFSDYRIARIDTGSLQLQGDDTIDVLDDDPSTISVSVDSTVVGEDDASVLTYTFTRDIASANASSLDVEFQLSGSATIGEDYTASAASQVSFAVGASTATVMVDPTPDSLIEADETVTVTILDSEEYLLAESYSASASITNDDLGGESPQVAGIVYFNEDAEVEQSFSLHGTGQRSIIRKVQVTFSGPVAVPLGPVSDDSFVVESMSKRRQGTRVGLEIVSSDVVSGQQVVVLKFTGRELVENASLKRWSQGPMLIDGEYRLTVGGDLLGIDANGADFGSDATDEFFRLFGDSDGDRDIDGNDQRLFFDNYENGDWNFLFDFDSRPSRTATDEIEFTKRYGARIF